MDMIDAWSDELGRARIATIPESLRLICQRDLLVSFVSFQVAWAVIFCRELGVECKELEHPQIDSLDAVQRAMQTMSWLRDAVQRIPAPTEAAKPTATAIAKNSCGGAGAAAIKANYEREHRRALGFWSPLVGSSGSLVSKAAIDASHELMPRIPVLMRSMPMLFRSAYFAAAVARIGGGSECEIITAARAGAAGCALAISSHELAAFSWLVGFEALRKGIASCRDSTSASMESCITWLRARARLIGNGRLLMRSTERGVFQSS